MMCRLVVFLFITFLFCCLIYNAAVDAHCNLWFTITCNKRAQYRTIDGTCNNLDHPRWGSVGEPYQRLLPPEYQDGKDTPRVYRKDGRQPLPSPRLVSTTVHGSASKPCSKGTVFSTVWGQFIAHDVAFTSKEKEEIVDACCSPEKVARYDACQNQSSWGPCFPVFVPKGDRYFTKTSTRCLKLARATPKYDRTGIRQQFNKLSAFIDGTTVYGAHDSDMNKLRAFSQGRLQETSEHSLPRSQIIYCRKNSISDYCLQAGDHRVNVYPSLAALHTIFVRFHNYVAGKLKKAHCSYSDETAFQEARKIVIGVMQHITFSEYLPTVLGQKYISKYGLANTWKYDPNINPTLFNAVPTAAFRFGHSMVTNSLRLRGVENLNVKMFLRPHFVLHGGLSDVLTSSASRKCETVDGQFSKGMTDQLFEDAPQKGRDIVSLNIQRGRDHGLPPYNKFRHLCGLNRYSRFSEMASGSLFSRVYKHVDDIDLYSGAMTEAPDGGYLGPTFSCLLGKQFQRLRNGDRFWFESRTVGFTSQRLAQLKKTKLSHVICLTTTVSKIQEDVFSPVSSRNPLVCCSVIKTRAMDLRFF